MSGFLQQMAQSSRERLEQAKRERPQSKVLEDIQSVPPPPRLVASGQGFDLIAELKLRSPAVGQLRGSDEDVVSRVQSYARAGAAAVSVLTEPSRFDGSMQHLEMATRALAELRVPAMRKDFLLDPYQVLEARAAGAGGVLVILRMLHLDEINGLLDCARREGLFVLIEAFDERDIERAHAIIDARLTSRGPLSYQDQLLVGVNCRDLATLQVVPGRLEQLAHLLPTSVPRVAESGVGSAEDARRAASAGYDFALVGSALMQGNDPIALVKEMLTAGRSVHPARAAGQG